MQKSNFLPDNINVYIHRPACSKCHAYMMLARIMPARIGFDLHTFECPKCDHVHEVMVETAPAEVGLIMEQDTQHPPDSRVWDDRATEVIAEAREMRRQPRIVRCSICSDTMVAPEASVFKSDGEVSHLWSCDTCGQGFVTEWR